MMELIKLSVIDILCIINTVKFICFFYFIFLLEIYLFFVVVVVVFFLFLCNKDFINKKKEAVLGDNT
jgi:hypothetical protein